MQLWKSVYMLVVFSWPLPNQLSENTLLNASVVFAPGMLQWRHSMQAFTWRADKQLYKQIWKLPLRCSAEDKTPDRSVSPLCYLYFFKWAYLLVELWSDWKRSPAEWLSLGEGKQNYDFCIFKYLFSKHLKSSKEYMQPIYVMRDISKMNLCECNF